MENSFSFGWYYLGLGLAYLLIILATILIFFAPSYLQTTNTASTSSAVVANNKTATSYFYGAGVAGIIAFLILLFITFYTLYYRTTDYKLITTPEDVVKYQYGWGTYIGIIFIIIILILMIVLIILGISYIDGSTANNGGSSARGFAWGSVVVGALALIPIFIMWWRLYTYNQFLKSLVKKMVVDKPKDSVEGLYSFIKNPNNMNEFEGTIKLNGYIKGKSAYTYINGKREESTVPSHGRQAYEESYTVGNPLVVNQSFDEKAVKPDQLVNVRNNNPFNRRNLNNPINPKNPFAPQNITNVPMIGRAHV